MHPVEGELGARLQELNSKATQLLTFLSFAVVAAILLETNRAGLLSGCQIIALKLSLRFWVFSIFPVLLVVLPVKEFVRHEWVRTAKVVFLWVALCLIALGAAAFLCAVW